MVLRSRNDTWPIEGHLAAVAVSPLRGSGLGPMQKSRGLRPGLHQVAPSGLPAARHDFGFERDYSQVSVRLTGAVAGGAAAVTAAVAARAASSRRRSPCRVALAYRYGVPIFTTDGTFGGYAGCLGLRLHSPPGRTDEVPGRDAASAAKFPDALAGRAPKRGRAGPSHTMPPCPASTSSTTA